MKLFKESIQLLLKSDQFKSISERVVAVIAAAVIFLIIGFLYVYKPIVLFFFIVASFLVFGWFMLVFLFPEFHDRFNAFKRALSERIKTFRGD